MYTKACGAEELWSDYVLGGSFDGLFAGVLCPDESSQRVSEIIGRCTASAGVEPEAVEEVSVYILSLSIYIYIYMYIYI